VERSVTDPPLDGLDIAVAGTFNPRRVGAEHGGDAVAVLLGHPERILADHEIPTDGGVARDVGSSIPKL
jgi:hypothetical protein